METPAPVPLLSSSSCPQTPSSLKNPSSSMALGAGESIPPLSSLVQAHSPEELPGPWMGTDVRSPCGPHGLHQALHLICCVPPTRPLTLGPVGLAPVP